MASEGESLNIDFSNSGYPQNDFINITNSNDKSAAAAELAALLDITSNSGRGGTVIHTASYPQTNADISDELNNEINRTGNETPSLYQNDEVHYQNNDNGIGILQAGQLDANRVPEHLPNGSNIVNPFVVNVDESILSVLLSLVTVDQAPAVDGNPVFVQGFQNAIISIRCHSEYEEMEIVEYNTQQLDTLSPTYANLCDSVYELTNHIFNIIGIIKSFDDNGKPTMATIANAQTQSIAGLILGNYELGYIRTDHYNNNNGTFYCSMDVYIKRRIEILAAHVIPFGSRSNCVKAFKLEPNKNPIDPECIKLFHNIVNGKLENKYDVITVSDYVDHLRLYHSREIPRLLTKKIIAGTVLYTLEKQKDREKLNQYEYIKYYDNDIAGVTEMLEKSPLLKKYNWRIQR